MRAELDERFSHRRLSSRLLDYDIKDLPCNRF